MEKNGKQSESKSKTELETTVPGKSSVVFFCCCLTMQQNCFAQHRGCAVRLTLFNSAEILLRLNMTHKQINKGTQCPFPFSHLSESFVLTAVCSAAAAAAATLPLLFASFPCPLHTHSYVFDACHMDLANDDDVVAFLRVCVRWLHFALRVEQMLRR